MMPAPSRAAAYVTEMPALALVEEEAEEEAEEEPEQQYQIAQEAYNQQVEIQSEMWCVI